MKCLAGVFEEVISNRPTVNVMMLSTRYYRDKIDYDLFESLQRQVWEMEDILRRLQTEIHQNVRNYFQGFK